MSLKPSMLQEYSQRNMKSVEKDQPRRSLTLTNDERAGDNCAVVCNG